MIELKYFNVYRAAEDIVREVGFEHRYIAPGNTEPVMGQSCYNWHGDGNGEKVPGCIVGTILHRLGVPLKEMIQNVGSNILIGDLVGAEVISFPSAADHKRTERFLRTAQIAQDAGATWHSAVKVAEYTACNSSQ